MVPPEMSELFYLSADAGKHGDSPQIGLTGEWTCHRVGHCSLILAAKAYSPTLFFAPNIFYGAGNA